MQERILLAPNGTELLRTLARHGFSTLGLRIMSPAELAAFMLMRSGVPLPSEIAAHDTEANLIYRFLTEIPYFQSASYRDALNLADTLRTLRFQISGNERDSIVNGLQNSPFTEKNQALLAVYDRYLAALQNNALIDTVGMIRFAIAHARPLTADLFRQQDDILDQFPLIRSAFAFLRQAVHFGYDRDSAALLETISDSVGLLAKTGSASLEYYCYALELLRCKQRDGLILTHADAADFLSDLLDTSGTERCVSLSPDENRVHIANLHKVKGLEAPIVILADPKITERIPALRMIYDTDQTECYVFALKNDTTTYTETNAYPEELQSERDCMTEEKLRLLYVAATRAQQLLIVADSLQGGTGSSNNPWEPFLQLAEGRISACIPENPNQIPVPAVRTDGGKLYKKAEAQSVLNEPSVPQPTYQILRPSHIRLHTVLSEEVSDRSEEVPTDRNAVLTGTLVHRLMECIVSGGIPENAEMLLTAILNESGAEEPIYRPLLRNVLETMTHGGYPQEGGTESDLLAVLHRADEVYCEVPFCLRRNAEIVHGVIDLLYRSGSTWQIIDYKTNAERHGLAEKYASQLIAYQQAVRELLGADACADIYHIDV